MSRPNMQNMSVYAAYVESLERRIAALEERAAAQYELLDKLSDLVYEHNSDFSLHSHKDDYDY